MESTPREQWGRAERSDTLLERSGAERHGPHRRSGADFLGLGAERSGLPTRVVGRVLAKIEGFAYDFGKK